MMRAGILCAAPLLLGATQPMPAIPLSAARLPGFAAELANRPMAQGPDFWAAMPRPEALEKFATVRGYDRQSARWDYALGELAARNGPEALGALDTMLGDDPDMALVPAFRLARGAALARLNRPAEALDMLTDPILAGNAEACMLRLFVNAQLERAAAALSELRCAIPAINARKVDQAGSFIRAAAWAAIHTNNAKPSLGWLAQLPDGDGASNILRGEALIALGYLPEGRLRLDRVRANGTAEQKIEAELTLVEALVARGKIAPAEATKRLDRILFLWRGGEIEQRALILGYMLAERQNNDVAMLRFGGMLLRYGEPGARAAVILGACQQRMMAILSPASGLKLADAAGLFWDNRDLAPTGADGDRMLARLYILAGMPERAVLALRESDQPAYPPAILDARRHVQAIALYQLGRTGDALALTEDNPGLAALRAEMLWRRRDWRSLAGAGEGGPMPAKGALSAVDQALILRRAVALAMLSDERGLGALRARYAGAFARLPSGPAFALLTGPVNNMSGEGITRAMAAIPAVSVAGQDDDLLDASRQRVDAQMAYK